MEIKIIMASKLNDKAALSMFREYANRLATYVKFDFLDFKSSNYADENVVKREDGKKLLESSKGYYRILLDENGKSFDSIKFSEWLSNLLETRKKLAFLIGGSYGHDKSLTGFCDEIISLSKLTMAHQLALAVLAEQIYRGMTIRYGHPYHK
jgi:23S rRNA (pseudouridine1915-N3)-methyltransferase